MKYRVGMAMVLLGALSGVSACVDSEVVSPEFEEGLFSLLGGLEVGEALSFEGAQAEEFILAGGADGAEDVVESGRGGGQVNQLDAVVVRPVEEPFELSLQLVGLDGTQAIGEHAVVIGRVRQCRDGGIGALPRRAPASSAAHVHSARPWRAHR